jgi:CheY-like chemotaxis protein
MVPARTVLIVDDDPILRRVVKVWLQQRGYRAAEAKDIAAALRIAREQPIWLTLTDLSLAQGDGLMLARVLRSEQPSMPVVLMTGHPVKLLALPPGAADAFAAVLTKPFAWGILEELLEHLETHPAEDAACLAKPVLY